ncbi:uncharacterized protein Z518_00339 [Rhinocladiella mackenziei CBS 650.93]|uniref:Uncharacterized protein n=1 Tax=Rhinocladiella mackenziei CBS 650.93 TaxID=1442369 RepID=A0A0D2JIK0_9EURO|nr:uncharacterized protein Z518_00339 [Rhinocladiella mackenziei CBS 650.93]KIX09260.1 hypothetical protein Z518_00339 [Rhinocladiella mackenziei CBS 650.93]
MNDHGEGQGSDPSDVHQDEGPFDLNEQEPYANVGLGLITSPRRLRRPRFSPWNSPRSNDSPTSGIKPLEIIQEGHQLLLGVDEASAKQDELGGDGSRLEKDKHEEELQTLNKKIEKLQVETEKLRIGKTTMENQLRGLASDNDDLRGKLHQYKQQHQQMKQENKKLSNDLQRIHTSLHDTEEKYSAQLEKNRPLIKEIEDLKKDLRIQYEGIQKKMTDAHHENLRYQEKWKTKSNEVESLMKEMGPIKASRDRSEEALQASEQECNRLCVEIEKCFAWMEKIRKEQILRDEDQTLFCDQRVPTLVDNPDALHSSLPLFVQFERLEELIESPMEAAPSSRARVEAKPLTLKKLSSFDSPGPSRCPSLPNLQDYRNGAKVSGSRYPGYVPRRTSSLRSSFDIENLDADFSARESTPSDKAIFPTRQLSIDLTRKMSGLELSRPLSQGQHFELQDQRNTVFTSTIQTQEASAVSTLSLTAPETVSDLLIRHPQESAGFSEPFPLAPRFKEAIETVRKQQAWTMSSSFGKRSTDDTIATGSAIESPRSPGFRNQFSLSPKSLPQSAPCEPALLGEGQVGTSFESSMKAKLESEMAVVKPGPVPEIHSCDFSPSQAKSLSVREMNSSSFDNPNFMFSGKPASRSHSLPDERPDSNKKDSVLRRTITWGLRPHGLSSAKTFQGMDSDSGAKALWYGDDQTFRKIHIQTMFLQHPNDSHHYDDGNHLSPNFHDKDSKWRSTYGPKRSFVKAHGIHGAESSPLDNVSTSKYPRSYLDRKLASSKQTSPKIPPKRTSPLRPARFPRFHSTKRGSRPSRIGGRFVINRGSTISSLIPNPGKNEALNNGLPRTQPASIQTPGSSPQPAGTESIRTRSLDTEPLSIPPSDTYPDVDSAASSNVNIQPVVVNYTDIVRITTSTPTQGDHIDETNNEDSDSSPSGPSIPYQLSFLGTSLRALRSLRIYKRRDSDASDQALQLNPGSISSTIRSSATEIGSILGRFTDSVGSVRSQIWSRAEEPVSVITKAGFSGNETEENVQLSPDASAETIFQSPPGVEARALPSSWTSTEPENHTLIASDEKVQIDPGPQPPPASETQIQTEQEIEPRNAPVAEVHRLNSLPYSATPGEVVAAEKTTRTPLGPSSHFNRIRDWKPFQTLIVIGTIWVVISGIILYSGSFARLDGRTSSFGTTTSGLRMCPRVSPTSTSVQMSASTLTGHLSTEDSLSRNIPYTGYAPTWASNSRVLSMNPLVLTTVESPASVYVDSLRNEDLAMNGTHEDISNSAFDSTCTLGRPPYQPSPPCRAPTPPITVWSPSPQSKPTSPEKSFVPPLIQRLAHFLEIEDIELDLPLPPAHMPSSKVMPMSTFTASSISTARIERIPSSPAVSSRIESSLPSYLPRRSTEYSLLSTSASSISSTVISSFSTVSTSTSPTSLSSTSTTLDFHTEKTYPKNLDRQDNHDLPVYIDRPCPGPSYWGFAPLIQRWVDIVMSDVTIWASQWGGGGY